jgi:glucose/arabinose dehydrogenase
MNRRKTIAIVALIMLVGCILLASMLYFWLRSRVNLAAFLAPSGFAEISVPPGFEVNKFAEGLDGPRFMSFGPDGTLYVAERGQGRIVTLIDQDRDGRADDQRVFASDLDRPHSLTHYKNAWYVGVPNGVIRLVDNDDDGTADSQETIVDDYPTKGHFTRTILFLPDGRMVVSVGSSCNVCEEGDPRRTAIVVYDDESGTGERIFASGLRNAVGLALHPNTGELWATNNGRDLMGDDLPPETLYIVAEGTDYGWPVCHNGYIVDPDMGYEGACDDVPAPLLEMQAHSAPLGLEFYTGDTFPAEYRDDLFIAFHGSWNRSEPTGYKIVRLPLDGEVPAGPLEDFATGWLDEATGAVDGRPVDVVQGPEGALYISDDKGGTIYRITAAQGR